jgi:hypothetical protein
MRTQLYLAGARFALVGAVLTMLLLVLVACQQSQTPAPAPAAGQKAVASEKVFIEFRGPWAFAPDPRDANSILAIAPKAKGHRDLYLQASNQSTLPSGLYELALPSHSGSAAATVDPSIAQAKIDAPSLQRALDNKSTRYAIRLPKPEEYVVASRARSRLGAAYPPDAATEKDYATAVSLRYNVGTLNGFSLAGVPDSGAFNPILLQVETPVIHFVIAPAEEDDPNDKCDSHSRESFLHLTTLLGLTMYVDFPENPGDCHKNDPQNTRPVKAEKETSSFEEVAALLRARMHGHGAGEIDRHLMAVIYFYFFDHPGGDCKAPVIVLSSGQ